MYKKSNEAKCFIKSEDGYEEITNNELLKRIDTNPSYAVKKFIPLHGMLMEVSKQEYAEFYRDRRRQKYLRELSVKNGEISFDMLTTDDRCGENILIDHADVEAQAINQIIVDKLHECLSLLSADDRKLIYAIYFDKVSEREYAAKTGIPQRTINDRKRRLLARLKKYLE